MADDDNNWDHYEPFITDGHVFCPRCDGHQTVPCHCGGHLCFCENQGDECCPLCGGEYGGEGYVSKEVYDRWWERNKEYHEAFRAALKTES